MTITENVALAVITNIEYRDSVRAGVIMLANDAPRPSNGNISLYPNPATDAVQVAGGEFAHATITFIDALGKTVVTMPFDGSLTDLSRFAAGTYTVQLTTAKQTYSGRLVVQK